MAAAILIAVFSGVTARLAAAWGWLTQRATGWWQWPRDVILWVDAALTPFKLGDQPGPIRAAEARAAAAEARLASAQARLADAQARAAVILGDVHMEQEFSGNGDIHPHQHTCSKTCCRRDTESSSRPMRHMAIME